MSLERFTRRSVTMNWMTTLGVLLACLVQAPAKYIPPIQAEVRHQGGSVSELWLADYERLSKDYDPSREMQADAPPPGRAPGFPGTREDCPPALGDDGKCQDSPNCVTDDDCKAGGKCCDSPCSKGKVCYMVPAVVDWLREPRRKEKDGTAWLIDSNEEEHYDNYEDDPDWCTTTPPDEDEDALRCPHGFTCHIDDPGDPENDIPNRGRCIEDQTQENALNTDIFANNLESSRSLLPKELLDSGVCVYQNSIITEGKTFAYHGLPCKCREGNIVCRVARPRFPFSKFR